jgi:SAM-dependent methyltransferase
VSPPAQFEKSYYENPMFWEEARYGGAETEKARLVLNWIPADVDSILDVGCGNGWFTNHAAKHLKIIGVDRSWVALKHLTTTCCQADAGALPFQDRSFDLIVAMEVLEHLTFDRYTRAINELARVSRRYVLVTVPFSERLNLKSAVCPACGCKFHRWYHMRSFSRKTMKRLLAKADDPLQLRRLEGALAVQQIPLLSNALRLFHWRFQQRFPLLSTCPMCGFAPKKRLPGRAGGDGRSSSPLADLFKKIETQIPFKSTTYRWWVGLYEK